MMIFPAPLLAARAARATRKAYKSWLDGEGIEITSFCYPLLDNNPNGVDG